MMITHDLWLLSQGFAFTSPLERCGCGKKTTPKVLGSLFPRERSERGEKRYPEPNPKTNEPRRLL